MVRGLFPPGGHESCTPVDKGMYAAKRIFCAHRYTTWIQTTQIYTWGFGHTRARTHLHQTRLCAVWVPDKCTHTGPNPDVLHLNPTHRCHSDVGFPVLQSWRTQTGTYAGSYLGTCCTCPSLETPGSALGRFGGGELSLKVPTLNHPIPNPNCTQLGQCPVPGTVLSLFTP